MIEGFEKTEPFGESDNIKEVENLEEALEPGEDICSKKYSKIFGTNYYWSVPYLINVEKYKQYCGTCMYDENIKSIKLSCDMHGEREYSKSHFTLYVWPNNYTKWQYDCFQFGTFGKYADYEIKDFINFVIGLTDCIEGVDMEAVQKLTKEYDDSIESIMQEKNALIEISNNY